MTCSWRKSILYSCMRVRSSRGDLFWNVACLLAHAAKVVECFYILYEESTGIVIRNAVAFETGSSGTFMGPVSTTTIEAAHSALYSQYV